MNRASAAIPTAPRPAADPRQARHARQPGARLDRAGRPRSGASVPTAGRGSASPVGRVELTAGRRPVPVDGGRGSLGGWVGGTAAGLGSDQPGQLVVRGGRRRLRPPMRTRRTRRTRRPRRDLAAASRSAALPARPWPSTVRPASRSAPGVGCRAARRARLRGPRRRRRPVARRVAHDRRLAWTAGRRRSGVPGRRRCRASSSMAWRSSGARRPRRPSAAVSARSPAPRACAASRRAQSWNVGQTGNALDRQYASWCATARGAGGDSAKQRWRWSGLVDRPSRSSPNATNGQAGAPSMPGSARSVIPRMIPARFQCEPTTRSAGRRCDVAPNPVVIAHRMSHAHGHACVGV